MTFTHDGYSTPLALALVASHSRQFVSSHAPVIGRIGLGTLTRSKVHCLGGASLDCAGAIRLRCDAIFPANIFIRWNPTRFVMPAFFSAVSSDSMREEFRLQITYAATFANLVADYHAVLASRRMPTIRLLPLAGLLGGSGSNTLFPVVGTVKVPSSP